MQGGRWRRERKEPNLVKLQSLSWTPAEDKPPKPLRRSALHSRVQMRDVRRFAAPSGRKYSATSWDAKCKLAQAGRRGIRYERERRVWRKAIFALHGERCIYPGCNSTGPFEIAHAYGKGAHPELHVAIHNGFPCCVGHHRVGTKGTFQFDPVLTKALQECADEMRAAVEGRRPQPSFAELQDIIARRVNGE